jgi:two-component system nitrogen regulation response regulator GlnG
VTRVLVADDDRGLRMVMSRALAGRDLEVIEAEDGRQAWEILRGDPVDVAVVDIRMPQMTGLELLRRAADLRDKPQIIVITAQNTMANAIEAMKAGAYEYLCKPFDLEELEELVLRAAGDRQRSAQGTPDALETGTGQTLYGRSPAMQRVFKAIGRAAGRPHAVLITGESGTGKELVAKILHQEGPRGSGPFVAVNAAAIPSELLEAELFGHARGAFTGAHADRRGKFEAADGGTLFLDEIGEMPSSLQAKLLRVLEDKTFYRLGATQQVRVDVRIVCATNRDLAEEVRAGRFRGDLYWRLNVLNIDLPPLRERREDIPLLAEWLLAKHAKQEGRAAPGISEDALARLTSYTWPGNVRELENTLVRAATFAQGGVIHEADLFAERGAPGDAGDEGFEAALVRQLRGVVRTWPEPTKKSPSELHALVVGTAEKVVIALALERTRGNQLQAAKLLGINRNTLKRKLDDYALDPADFRGRR